ncbi:hypothetical protein K4F52_003181 [Lecanicillium sp. MT-2017a]|nr:hypothetical protein K4F52_003181 [Lecanicillium sp. MT-2017a]
MESTSRRSPSILASLKTSLRSLLHHPLRTLTSRPVALVFLLYGGTYLTANTIDTVSSTLANRPARTTTSGPAKFAASSAANVSLCIYKDQAFVKLFGPMNAASAPRPVPLPCLALFALRDSMTIFASFNVPPLLAPVLEQYTRQSSISGLTAAQFAAPAAIQLFSTPLHLLGLDLYNRPNGGGGGGGAAAPGVNGATIAWRDRWHLIRSRWLASTAARIGRIVPAFGVGGVVNYKVRQSLLAMA